MHTLYCYLVLLSFGLHLMINICPAVSHRITQFYCMLQHDTFACNYSDVLVILVFSADGILEFLRFLLKI